MANVAFGKAWQAAYLETKAPGVFYLLKALRLHLASNKLAPDLSLTLINGLTNASNGTNSNNNAIAAAATTLYAIYLKKRTGSTANYFKVTNHASTGTTDGTQDLGYKITTAAEENLFTFPNGHAMSAGITISQDTAATGATCSLLIDVCDGFVIHAL